MSHTLTEEELSKFRQAFANCDTTGQGTIMAGDLCKLMELLGENLPPELQRLFGRPDVENDQICFDEFVNIVVGPRWSTVYYEQDKSLLEAIADVDDGSGYVPLRTFLCIAEEYMEEAGYVYTDDELVDLYRTAFDVSVFEAAGGSLPPSMMWKVFEEELADVRGTRKAANFEPAAFKEGAADDGQSTCEIAGMINFTVVDLGGKQLMVAAVASTWSVETLQQYIAKVVGLPAHRQILFFAEEDGFRHVLSPSGACLSTSGVLDGSALLLIAKDELRVDYRKFVARVLEAEMGHTSCA